MVIATRVVIHLKRAGGRSVFLQRIYAWAEFWWGQIASLRGRPFLAIDHFCKASRRISLETPSRMKAREKLRDVLGPNKLPQSISSVQEDFLRTSCAKSLRARFLPQPFPMNITFRHNLMPLKAYNPITRERGVLVLKYNYLFQAFHAIFNTAELRHLYWIILEPSFYRFEDPAYALFGGWKVLLQAGNPVLQAGLRAVGSSFNTVPLTSSDWIDYDLFVPLKNQTKVYDVIYVANWSENKQHELLFRTLAKFQRPLRVALVGFRWERKRDEIERIARKYNGWERCDIFEDLPPREVNLLLNKSRINLLLSRFESGNKSLYEAMFADIPSVVYRHCEGLNYSCINDQTGVLSDAQELGDAILTALGNASHFSPRAWALGHTGYSIATRIVDDTLRDLSHVEGEPWHTDIAAKVNRPSLDYKHSEDAIRLEPALHHLLGFVRN